MRIFYFLLKIVLQYALRIFYPRIRRVNAPKRFLGRTIYVSNHAASFMDPLIVGVLQRPIVFFMTRSDVFTKFTRPILWAGHLLPIYRQQDGEDTKLKNQQVFEKCTKILSFGRNLLIFGEGFTDDVFIRSLKPVKKGAARIGFEALESLNWEKKIYMAAIGINYGDPNHMGSDLLLSNSEPFCLNDYKEEYLENPAKVINDVTKRVETLMQEQLTYVEDKDWAEFHEQICRLRRNGMNPVDHNPRIPLKQRWHNSRKLALWMNAQDLNANPELQLLKKDSAAYFVQLKKLNIEEKMMYELSQTGKLKTASSLFKLIVFSPFIIPGLIHFFLPYILVKRFAEKSFRRKVFWSSVKVTLGMLSMGLWNIPLVWALNHFFIHSSLIAFCYYMFCPILGLLTYEWFRILHDVKAKKRLRKMKLDDLLTQRKSLMQRAESLVEL